MVTRDTAWPEGTPCWVDLEVGDITKADMFYAAQFGWDIRTRGPEAGPSESDEKGNLGGRPKSYTDEQCQTARTLKDVGTMTGTEIAAAVGVSRRTLTRMLTDEPAS